MPFSPSPWRNHQEAIYVTECPFSFEQNRSTFFLILLSSPLSFLVTPFFSVSVQMPKLQGTAGGKVERTRTFTGCRTCRSRHAKCDEAQPECGTCQRLGLSCGGYGARLFWITDDGVKPELQQSHRGSEYRYPLFSGTSSVHYDRLGANWSSRKSTQIDE
jgi:hypothetical protein